MWLDPRSGLLIQNTLLLALAASAISLPIGAILAFLLARTDLPLRRLLGACIVLLLFTPLYVQAAAWQSAFGLAGWFSASEGAVLLDGWRGAVWVHAAAAVPWVTLIIASGLVWVEPALEEEALLEGSIRQVFCRVTVPSALGSIGAAALWVAVTTAGEMTVTDLFKVRTYAEELYTELAVEPGEVPLRLLPGLFATGLLIACGLLLAMRLAPVARPGGLRRPLVFHLGRWRWPSFALAAVLSIGLLGVPVASLCRQAGMVVTKSPGGELIRSWSPAKCARLVADVPWEFFDEFRWSIELGVLAATAAVAVALPLAWLARQGGWRATPAVVVAAFTFAVPGPLVGLALVFALNRQGSPLLNRLYDSDLFCPWLALTLRVLPLATLILWHALASVAAAPLEAAAGEGAGPAARFFRIALPQRAWALAAAWLAALAASVGDVSASILVLPPGVATVSWKVFDLLHGGAPDKLAALSLGVLLAVSFLAAAVVACLARGR